MVLVAFGGVELARVYLEANYIEQMELEIKQKTFEVTAQTMHGNIMGSVANLGLVNPSMKAAALGELEARDNMLISTLQAVGELYHATGVYVINAEGVVKTSWVTIGKTLTGINLSFRPYFKMAMQGKQNIYAAIGTTTGERSLYFAAPLYRDVSAASPIIGATVARLDVERIDQVLNKWQNGHALLLSPQGIVFASTNPQWIENISTAPTTEVLNKIRALKQFGNTFETGSPQVLPFNINNQTLIVFDAKRYAVKTSEVEWNDPNGAWTLILLGNLDDLMPASLRTMIIVIAILLILVLSFVFLWWRRSLQQANQKRQHAEAHLNDFADKMQLDSLNKSFLLSLSNEMHQARTLFDFSQVIMQGISSRITVMYGAFYVLDVDNKMLIPTGGKSVLIEDLSPIMMGEGLVGQCAQQATVMIVNDAALSGINMTVSAGTINITSLILLPVKTYRETLLGVMVLASVSPLNDEDQALLTSLLEVVGMNLDILLRNLSDDRFISIDNSTTPTTKVVDISAGVDLW
jgi:putative methionine-R-sulfoxide reductase with GAF domain